MKSTNLLAIVTVSYTLMIFHTLSVSLKTQVKVEDTKVFNTGRKVVRKSPNFLNPDNLDVVEIRKEGSNLGKSPQYIQPASEDGMKAATIITNSDNTSIINNGHQGMNEKPNYLSSVIRSFPTSVATVNHLYDEDSSGTTYDLDSIKKKGYFEMLTRAKSQDNPNVLMFGGDNQMSPILPIPSVLNTPAPDNIINKSTNAVASSNNLEIDSSPQLLITGTAPVLTNSLDSKLQLPSIEPIPSQIMNNLDKVPSTIVHHDQIPHIATTSNDIHKTFNMNVSYKGQINHNHPNLSELVSLENKVDHIETLNTEELNHSKQRCNTVVIEELKLHEKRINETSTILHKNIKRYESQNSVILESLRDQIAETTKDLNNMVGTASSQEREIIVKELSDEFTRSLSGYNINKARYSHLNNIDQKELSDISNAIKNELNSNKNFYLRGDYNFYN